MNNWTKHGFTYKGGRKERFYRIFYSIRVRCNKKSHKQYPQYGGRGIKCLWNSFIEFRNDMHESYLKHVEKFGEKNTTIDRIDNDGSYCKENCRWATRLEQAKTSSKSKLISFNGETKTMRQWAIGIGIKDATFRWRIRRGWPIDRVMSPMVR